MKQLHQKQPSSIRTSFKQYKYSKKHHHRCFEDDYQKLSDIGQGSYGDVFTVKQKNGEIRAIKRIVLNPLSQDFQQVQKLKMFQSDHIIQYYGYIVQNQFLYIIMKYCKGNLRDLIKNNRINTTQQVINLIMQITSAMLCLEEKKVMHLDLKPENILYEDQGYFKICDFGCSRLYQSASKLSHMNKKAQKSHFPVHFNQSDQFIFGTPQYIAPQVQLNANQIPRSSCDVWSMGIILYELIYHKHPFKINIYGKVQTQDFKAFKQNQLQIDFPQTQQNYPINLIKQMLKPNQFKRITWNKIRLYLIQHYGKQQASFINIQRAANNQINISIIFISVAYTIESYKKKQQDLFMKDNLKELIGIKFLLIKLAHGLLIKFYRLFDYKIKNKLNARTRISLQFMFENTKQQYKKINIQQNFDDNKKIRKLQQDLYVKLDNLNNKITNQYKQRQEMIAKISCFAEQAIKLKSYFCEGHRFKNTYKIYQIQDQI